MFVLLEPFVVPSLFSGVIFLQRVDAQALLLERTDPINGSGRARNRGDAWNTVMYGRTANGPLVEKGLPAESGVDNEMDFAALDVIDDVWPAFIDFVDCLGGDTGVP